MAKKKTKKKVTRKKAPARKKPKPKGKAAATTKYVQAKIERFELSDLTEAPYNPRAITDVALKGLEASLQQFGLLAPPVVNVRDGLNRIVGGHQRVKAAQAKGATAIDCIVVELDDAKEREANLALNNAAIEGSFVPELTASVLARIGDLVGEEGLKTLGDLRFDTLIRQVQQTLEHRPGIDDEILHGKSDDDYIPTLLKSGAVSKLNTVYACGNHLLYCGRITAVGTLDPFNEGAAAMAFTRLTSKEEFKGSFLDAHLGHLLANTLGAVYVATNTDRIAQVQGAFQALGGHWSNTLVCFDPKQKPTPSDLHRDVTIPILYGWKEGCSRMYYGDRTQSNVWHLKASPPRRDVPVEAVVRQILNSSRKDDTVLDVQLATGATLIACEKTNRRLIGYVPSPREMDLVRRRWTRFVHGETENWKTATGAV